MAYTNKYGVISNAPSTTVLQYLETKPVHPLDYEYDGASGKHTVVFHPAGLQYPADGSPTRAKAGVGDDVAPIAGTNGLQLLQFVQSRFFLVFRTVAGAVVADGQCDVTVWHRARPGDDDAAAASPGPWLQGNLFPTMVNYDERIDTENYHREVYLQLTNLSGTALDHVDIYMAGVDDIFPSTLNVPATGLPVTLVGAHLEVGNLEVQLEASPDQVGEKADSVLLASTLDHTNVVAGNYQPPVAPIYIDGEGRTVIVGFAGDGGPTKSDSPVKIGGRDYAGAYAALTTALGGANDDLVYVARSPGAVGNAITIAYTDGGGGAPLTVTVVGTAITVDGDIGAGVTAAQAKAAIEASYEADALVTVDYPAGNDGTGNIAVMGAANLIGGTNGDQVHTLLVTANGAALAAAYHDNTTSEISARIERHDYPVGDYGTLVGGYASKGKPAAISNDADFSRAVQRMTGEIRITAEEALYGLIASPGAYSSPTDFTAIYASGTTISTNIPATFPALTPNDAQFMGVIEKKNNGLTYTYLPAEFEFDYNSGTGLLTVTGASFVNTSQYVVVFIYLPHGFNSLLGAYAIYLAQGLNYTTSSVTSREKPASGIDQGSVQVSNAAATPLVGSSTPCIEVTVQNQTTNQPIAIGGSSIAAAVNDGITLIGGASITLYIDNVQKINGYATINNQRLDFTYLTRP